MLRHYHHPTLTGDRTVNQAVILASYLRSRANNASFLTLLFNTQQKKESFYSELSQLAGFYLDHAETPSRRSAQPLT